MIELSAKIKETPFKLTLPDDSVVNLKATEFTVRDLAEIEKLQKPYVSKDSEDFTLEDSNMMLVARIVVSVKRETDGGRFWKSVSDVKQLPKQLIIALSDIVNELNPVFTPEQEEEKKKDS